VPIRTRIAEAKTKMAAVFAALPSITDSETWFYLAGGIGAVALAIGFIAAAAGLMFGWKMNREQQRKTAVQITKVESGAKERIGTVESAANERIETARAEATKEAKRIELNANQKIEEAKAQAQKDVAAARLRQDEIALELRNKAKELADAQRQAAEAQLALKKHLEEVAARQADRHLSTEQRSRLIEILTANLKGEINVTCIGGHPEPCNFARELVDALTKSGWTIKNFSEGVIFVGGSPAGLIMQVHDSEKVPVRATVLQEAFKQVGILAPGEVIPGLGEDTVSLVVGSKSNQ